jgi:hypothetical protein
MPARKTAPPSCRFSAHPFRSPSGDDDVGRLLRWVPAVEAELCAKGHVHRSSTALSGPSEQQASRFYHHRFGDSSIGDQIEDEFHSYREWPVSCRRQPPIYCYARSLHTLMSRGEWGHLTFFRKDEGDTSSPLRSPVLQGETQCMRRNYPATEDDANRLRPQP